MRKIKFSEEQIIVVLAEQERGMQTADVCRSLSDQKSHTISARTGSAITLSSSMDASPGASDLSDDCKRYRVPTSIRRHQI